MAEARPTPAFRTTLPLEGTEALLELDAEQLGFFRKATGIHDAEALRAHIIAVQREAYAVRPYTSITYFYFTDMRLPYIPAYGKLLELGRSRKNPIYLDVGCCFGVELRKAILDGYPKESTIATDIVSEFWDLGHRLFKTTPETFPVPFLAGDVFDPAFLEIIPPTYDQSPPPPPLSSVKKLSDLHGGVSAISICLVFHLFDTEAAQLQLARALACLLSPEPGSMILGAQHGMREKGLKKTHSFDMFCHSPESWAEMWDGQVFKKGTVKVEARLIERTRRFLKDGAAGSAQHLHLEWSVTRL